jgi:hypothetical protein
LLLARSDLKVVMSRKSGARQPLLMGTGEPTLVINPRDDDVFVAFVKRQFAAGPMSAIELEAQLRAQYPRVSIRERGLSGEAGATWYVYREGTWTRSET